MPSSESVQPTAAEIRALRWYHSLDLPGGVVTPGEYDLRPILERLPIPESLTGRRCIDVGGRDGFYAFEMERRGASEVVCYDLADPGEIHFPATATPSHDAVRDELDDGHRAFELAKSALGSGVERRLRSVYRLDPASDGEFDFGVIGTLLLHLRDPVGALTAIRGVLRGRLLINEAIAVGSSLFRRTPMAELYMQGGPFWWLCNPAGLRRMAEAAGFRVVEAGHPYLVPHGETPPPATPRLKGSISKLPRRLVQRRGSLHAWLLVEAA